MDESEGMYILQQCTAYKDREISNSTSASPQADSFSVLQNRNEKAKVPEKCLQSFTFLKDQ